MTPSLLLLEFSLSPRADGRLEPGLHDQLQAAALALLRALDPTLATWLHELPRDKPYTVGPPLVQGRYRGPGETVSQQQPMVWRLTALDTAVAEALSEIAQSPPDEVRFGTAGFAITAAEVVAATGYAQLRERWLGSTAPPPVGRLLFNFVGPTVFRRRGPDGRTGPLLWPEPTLIFERLLQRWRHAGTEELSELVTLPAGEPAVLLAWQGRTVAVPVQQRRQPGFLGQFEYGLVDGVNPAVLGLLTEFAPYAGLGARTTAGLGAVQTAILPPRRSSA